MINATSLQVLLVEDNMGDARLMMELLKEDDSLEYTIHHAIRLSDALQLLNEQTIDIVLLDLSLPDSFGFDTFTSMQDQAQNIPVVLLTGLDDENLAVNALKQGAQDYILKGQLDSTLLIRSIKYAIERQRLVVEMEKSRELEQHLAYHDVLTNLPNRLLFYDRLQQALIHAKRYSGLVAVLFLDLDGFKEINDKMGHAIGDQLLQNVAIRLKALMRESDTVARLGGDEFTMLLKGVHGARDVVKVAKKVLRDFSRPFVIGGKQVHLSISIGVSVFPYDGNDIESLVRKADFAMYRAKSEGKNNYQLFNVSMDSDASQNITFETSLREAINNRGLSVYFQPQFQLNNGAVIGFEALVRWQHPEKGLIQPSDFIPMAEETGLIVPLGEWVLRFACQQNKAWQDAGMIDVPVAVNLSARQFRERSLANMIEGVLDETGLEPRYLMLEITETNAMQDVAYTVSTLEVLKNMGVQIALDDFGTGYSSLSYLKRLPIDVLKIDKSFVIDIPHNPDDASIIAAIVTLTHSLGMQVIAEGVETEKQAAFLRSVNCDQVQGFYYSRPLAVEKVTDLIRDYHRKPIVVQEQVPVRVAN